MHLCSLILSLYMCMTPGMTHCRNTRSTSSSLTACWPDRLKLRSSFPNWKEHLAKLGKALRVQRVKGLKGPNPSWSTLSIEICKRPQVKHFSAAPNPLLPPAQISWGKWLLSRRPLQSWSMNSKSARRSRLRHRILQKGGWMILPQERTLTLLKINVAIKNHNAYIDRYSIFLSDDLVSHKKFWNTHSQNLIAWAFPRQLQKIDVRIRDTTLKCLDLSLSCPLSYRSMLSNAHWPEVQQSHDGRGFCQDQQGAW